MLNQCRAVKFNFLKLRSLAHQHAPRERYHIPILPITTLSNQVKIASYSTVFHCHLCSRRPKKKTRVNSGIAMRACKHYREMQINIGAGVSGHANSFKSKHDVCTFTRESMGHIDAMFGENRLGSETNTL